MRHQIDREEISEIEKLTVEVKQIASKAGANLVGVVLPRAIDALPKIWVGFKEIQDHTKKNGGHNGRCKIHRCTGLSYLG
jgi:hypothetical protein